MGRCLICGDTFLTAWNPRESEPCACGRNLTRRDLDTLEKPLKEFQREWQAFEQGGPDPRQVEA